MIEFLAILAATAVMVLVYWCGYRDGKLRQREKQLIRDMKRLTAKRIREGG